MMNIDNINNTDYGFDTDHIWSALAESGKFKQRIDFNQIIEFRKQLYVEALDEGVLLCISASRMPDSRPNIYISLRKNKIARYSY